MTSLQNLQAEVKEFLLRTPRINPESGVAFAERLQNFAANIYSMALQEALGKVPGRRFNVFHDARVPSECVGCTEDKAFNEARELTIQGIESLLNHESLS